MTTPPRHPLPKNNTKYTSEQHVWSYLLALRALPLANNNTKYTSGQHIGSYAWATRTLSLAKKPIQSTLRSNIFGHICLPCEHSPLQKKQYKVHFGATHWVICVGHASTLPCKKTIQSTLRGKILGRMSGPREHFPLQKTIQSTHRSNMIGHICWPCEHFPLQKNNTKYNSGQHLGSYVLATRALSLAQKTIQSARGAHK